MLTLQNYFEDQLPSIEDRLYEEIKSLNSSVWPVAAHILTAGGKRIRPILCILTARALGYEQKEIYPLACALELVHSATLLHDDVLDNAEYRRNNTAAHLLFGVNETILAGDALLALANKIVTEYKDISLITCISEAIFQTAMGEVLEIERIKEPTLSRDDYLEIVIGKTGYLIQTCCQSAAILAKSEHKIQEAARIFGLNLGIAFQLVDDALDYSVNLNNSGKPIGGDLREGKLTLPLIYFLLGLGEQERKGLLNKIKEHKLSSKEQNWILEQIGIKQLELKTRQEAQFYLKRAQDALDLFPSSFEQELLGQMLEYIQSRDV